MKIKFVIITLIIIVLYSCSGNKEQYYLILNNRDCLNCEEGLKSQLRDSTFHSNLIKQNVTVVFPNVRKFERQDLINILDLNDLTKIFDNEKYDYYTKSIVEYPPLLLKIRNDTIIEKYELRDTLIYYSDFFK
ncbi:MAG: hypothetical protein LBV69_04595 [Bacteroidales bacterium]|jgi:hypothetical protein|nr:hypothetical protein [Bacteroidales bacterium]